MFSITAVLVVLSYYHCSQAYAQEPWKGFYYHPQANTNNSHSIFLKDFEEMVKTLKAKGLNTIVFDMNYSAYHFTSDFRLKNASYPLNRGFSRAESRRMAEITRENGMQVMVALQVFTHSVGNVFPYVYPKYMLPGKAWREGVTYRAYEDFVQYKGTTYQCTSTRISSQSNAPGAKSPYWTPESSNTRDPFNKEGEAVVFKMIDELVDTFTVNGIKPVGFHIGSDEVGWWYDNPEQETGMTSAQIYAMAVTNTFNHIKAKHPGMEVIMWSDMLDPKWNGMPKSEKQNTSGRNTGAAIDLIPKDIIIADWRYEAKQRYRYDDARETFPSVGEFIDKGFRVWPTSWAEVKGTRDLVWTGNMEQARTGKVMGHLYSSWLMSMVPELKRLLNDPHYQVSDSALSVEGISDKPKYRKVYRDIAESILETAHLIDIKQCRGTEFNCGTYPDCEDLNRKSGYSGGEFKGYYCSDNKVLYKTLTFPSDYAGYWRFEGNALDESGRHNGALMKGATIVKDPERGAVLKLSDYGPHMRVKNNDRLKMGTGSLSIGAWFKAGASLSDFGTFVSKDPNFKSYNLFLHQNGKIWFEINGNSFYRISAMGINYRDSRWHHVVAIYDSSVPTINIYVDGTLSNGPYIYSKTGNDASSTSDLFVGNNDGLGQYEFHGLLDDLMIFNRVLTPAEVKLIYIADISGKPKKNPAKK
jgi:hypothetical protein